MILDEEGKTIYLSSDANWAFFASGFVTYTVSTEEDGTASDERMEYSEDYTNSDWISASLSYEVGEQSVTILGVGSIEYSEFLDIFITSLVLIVPIYMVLVALGSYLLARRALKPVNMITTTARSIRGNNWSQRIVGVRTQDEIGELARTLNEMMDDLETSYKRERQFTPNAAHELRTPLAVIEACTEDALHTGDDEIVHENLQIVKEENSKMTKIISQLLLLSKGYEGRAHFEPEEINLYYMTESVTEELSHEAERKNIKIHNEVPEKLIITADQSLFTQLLVNLTENAIKYGNENGNVWIMASEETGGVKIQVCDDGIGISKDDIDHTFERFYRADKARDRSGTGLGLSIAKWIVEMHKGHIYALSTPGQGTAFVIWL